MNLRHAGMLALVVVGTALTPGYARADANGDMFEKVVQLIEQAAVIVDMNKSNCDAMGDKLNALIDPNTQLLANAKAQNERLTPDQKRALDARFRPRIIAAMVKLRPGFAQCSSNAKVTAAVQKIQ
jgi:hypothetical protein